MPSMNLLAMLSSFRGAVGMQKADAKKPCRALELKRGSNETVCCRQVSGSDQRANLPASESHRHVEGLVATSAVSHRIGSIQYLGV